MDRFQEKILHSGLSHKDPLQAKILQLHRLNHESSSKKIYHLTLDIRHSQIQYQVGSCIGIYPKNPHHEIELIASLFDLDLEDHFFYERHEASISYREFLSRYANLDKVCKRHIEFIYEVYPHPSLATLLNNKEEIETYDHYSLLQEFFFPSLNIDAYFNLMMPLLPRYYSIASSPTKNPYHIDLLVAHVEYERRGRKKSGAFSSYLETLSPLEDTLEIFYQNNVKFTLPEDPSTPILMIGPGTGVAAFRGFIQERVAQNAPGNNWLFFGARNKAYDFYYEKELLDYVQKGFLQLDLAFSRDQKEKIYVQHRLWEHKETIWDWITKQKAHVYVCGDAKHMAKDVEAVLEKIAMHFLDISQHEAMLYLKQLRKDHRMHLDVY